MTGFRFILLALLGLISQVAVAQKQAWVDSVFATLTNDEKITQLMVIRASSMDKDGKPVIFTEQVMQGVNKYNVGAICLFQGGPMEHAALLNQVQKAAKTPVMVTVDAEWGLGMRFAGVKSFPFQITLGAVPDAEVAYKMGAAMAEQCKRMNIHVNYAPVADINNNPANPVIGARSFGEDKYKVALMATRIMLGMQDNGVMACAKHFPGHGDVSVDSHHDLPVINKSKEALMDLELYPFKELFARGVGSVMVAHLSIPAIDSTPNKPTSISYNNISQLMRAEMGYNGLTFTDALEMKGVSKFYPSGEAAVESIIAGNDMLCLPGSVPVALAAINKAIETRRLTWDQINEKCKRVLEAKYDYVYGKTRAVATKNLLKDLNKNVDAIRKQVAQQALTVVKGNAVQKHVLRNQKTAYVVVGNQPKNVMSELLRSKGVRVFYQPLSNDSNTENLLSQLKNGGYQQVWVGVHGLTRSVSNQFGLSKAAMQAIDKIGGLGKTSLLLFGNPYSLQYFDSSRFEQQIVCYEDDSVFQRNAFQFMMGNFESVGKLPVTVGAYSYGTGETGKKKVEVKVEPLELGLDEKILARIDTIAAEAIAEKATPGCVVAILRNNQLAFLKPYGYTDYEQTRQVTTDLLYDLASVTKTSATTIAVMKLYEEGKLDLKATVKTYLPWFSGYDKDNITIENLLLHQAGLNAFIPFYREVIDPATGRFHPAVFSNKKTNRYSVEVTENLFMKPEWVDTMYRRITTSAVKKDELQYVYSDNDFILLGKVVEAVSGLPLNEYVEQTFYHPMQLSNIGYKPYEHFPLSSIAPTENEKGFRNGLVWGYAHDPGAAMFGNVSGHAGLFGTASDLAALYGMLLDGGLYEGKRYLKKETIDWFTSYQTPISRRGLGFDKPDKSNDFKDSTAVYPSKWVSTKTFGHTGFTGTCVWVDPVYDLVYIFLSNRVNPSGSRKLLDLNTRGRIQDAIYESILF